MAFSFLGSGVAKYLVSSNQRSMGQHTYGSYAAFLSGFFIVPVWNPRHGQQLHNSSNTATPEAAAAENIVYTTLAS